MVSKQRNDSSTQSGSGPEIARHDAIQPDVQRPLASAAATAVLPRKREQELGFDKLFPVVARSPFDALVAGVENQLFVVSIDNAVDNFQKMTAVDAGVTMSRQRVTIDTHLFIEHLQSTDDVHVKVLDNIREAFAFMIDQVSSHLRLLPKIITT